MNYEKIIKITEEQKQQFEKMIISKIGNFWYIIGKHQKGILEAIENILNNYFKNQ